MLENKASFTQIPAEMRDLPQWVVWRSETREDKPTKVPYQAAGHGKARSNDPATWSTFEEAVACLGKAGVDGIGFVFSKDDPYVGIDLDNCIRDLKVADWAAEVVSMFSSYTEYSPSGTGLHIYVKGRLFGEGKGRAKNEFGGPHTKLEIYDRGRYFCMTGIKLPDAPDDIRECQDKLEQLVDKIDSKRNEADPFEITITGGLRAACEITDEELAAKAQKADNGAKFTRLWSGDTSEYDGDDSRADEALCCHLAFWTSKDAARIDRMFRQSGLYREKWNRADYREATIQKAISLTTKTWGGNGGEMVAVSDGDLPRIDAGCQHLPTVTTQAWNALTTANDPPSFFLHHGVPCRLELALIEDSSEKVAVLSPRELTIDKFRHELARAADWFVAHKNGERPARPPIEVVRDCLATPHPPLPHLRRVVETPVFTSDGRLLERPGFDEQSGIYFEVTIPMPAIPKSPQPSPVEEAKRWILDELLRDFPFVSDADRAHAVGCLLLPFVRDLIAGPTPLHLIESPVPGTGKGLLSAVLLCPGCGANVGIMPQARDDDEYRKRLLSILRDGRPAVVLDNLRGGLASGVLSAALTARVWDDRLLGRNEMTRLPVRHVWAATGNNISVSTEIARRTVRIRLDAKQDRAWLRDRFRHPQLMDWCRTHRGDLAWAALTLAQNWISAGRPDPIVKPLGSYEQWTRVIGGILETAGIPGFLDNMLEFYDLADTEGAALRVLVESWWQTHGETEVKTNELLELAKDIEGLPITGKSEQGLSVSFSKLLGRQRDRVIGDYCVIHCGLDSQTKTVRWKLHRAAESEGPQESTGVTGVTEVCSLPPRAREDEDEQKNSICAVDETSPVTSVDPSSETEHGQPNQPLPDHSCGYCGGSDWYYQPLANDREGGWVCRGCLRVDSRGLRMDVPAG